MTLQYLEREQLRSVRQTKEIPPHDRKAIVKFLVSIVARGENLPEEFAERIEAMQRMRPRQMPNAAYRTVTSTNNRKP
jgi:hypothetical protein